MWTLFVAAALLADAKSGSAIQVEVAKGSLVVVGGGTTTAAIVDKTLELAGGSKAKVVLIAEANPEYGPASLAASFLLH